ncbi:MAG: hypothetical protein KDA87_21995, partial [Planctomycetales bacterium]|nr:hypothetical protein [Planctomycetales bacterium]
MRTSRRKNRIESLEHRNLLAFSSHLLTDAVVAPSDFYAAGDLVYFVAETADSGRELWRTDGTSNGTFLLKDIMPGSESSLPQHLTKVGANVFFTADDGAFGRELWTTDGTSDGTYRISDINPNSGNSLPEKLTSVGDKLFFTAYSPSLGREVWSLSPGNESEFVLTPHEIVIGPGSPSVTNVWGMNGRAYYGGNNQSIWTSDATATGTYELTVAHSPTGVLVGQDKMFFIARSPGSGNEVWVSDGTIEGTHVTKDIGPGFTVGVIGSELLGLIDDVAYFWGNDPALGSELYRTDGTDEGTWLVKDITPGPDGSNGVSRLPFVHSGKIYFTANDGVHGTEVWVSDGTEQGTFLLSDSNIGNGGSGLPFPFSKATSSKVLFRDTRYRFTDGTPEGTVEYSGSVSSNIIARDDDAIFAGTVTNQFSGLLISDGTTEGTSVAASLRGGASNPRNLTELEDGRIVMSAYFNEVWVVSDTIPDAKIVTPSTLQEGGSLVMDASASTDPQGQSLSYAW